MIQSIPLDIIDRDPDQPRKTFDPVSIEELAVSLANNGLLQPIGVSLKDDGRFILRFGERRWRAHKVYTEKVNSAEWRPSPNLTLGHIDANVIVLSAEADKLELAIIENVQRSDMTPLEEALAYQQLVDKHGTQRAVATITGKPMSIISDRLNILKLPAAIQKFIGDGKVSKRSEVIRQILTLPAEQQVAFATQCVKRNASGSEIMRAIDKYHARKAVAKSSTVQLSSERRKYNSVAPAILFGLGDQDGEQGEAAFPVPMILAAAEKTCRECPWGDLSSKADRETCKSCQLTQHLQFMAPEIYRLTEAANG